MSPTRRAALAAGTVAALAANAARSQSNTIKGVRQVAHGDHVKVVEVVDIPAPVPAANEVVIEMEAAAMHLADVKYVHGDEGFTFAEWPRWMGTEGVGRITAVGSGVKEWKAGDRVFPPQGSGTYRQQLAVPADRVLAAPEGDADQLALTMINGLTAFLLLEDHVEAKPGEWIIQNGGNSSVARYLAVLAKRKGVKTIGIVRRENLIAELKAGGADEILVDTGNPNEMAEKVKAVTGGALVKSGIDCVAGPATTTIARCVEDGGKVINYGFMTGLPCHMAFIDLWRRRVRLTGMSLRNPRSREEVQGVLTFLAGLIGEGTLKAAIAATYPLARIHDALAHQQQTGSDRPGKIIIHPNG
ncbi:MAG: zinc-dependent alcohol dehydrogenase family protein [Alphaproteobacteria bacterium]|nr:zinc-dependent alcohol dehydrogenase family protein [Alphaproteobacteria bacterium]